MVRKLSSLMMRDPADRKKPICSSNATAIKTAWLNKSRSICLTFNKSSPLYKLSCFQYGYDTLFPFWNQERRFVNKFKIFAEMNIQTSQPCRRFVNRPTNSKNLRTCAGDFLSALEIGLRNRRRPGACFESQSQTHTKCSQNRNAVFKLTRHNSRWVLYLSF